MTDPIIQRLRQSSFFGDLPEAELQELASRVAERHLDPGEVLFRRNDIGDALYMIDRGLIKIVAPEEHGEEVILNQFGPGEVFGEMSLLDQAPRSAGATAASEAVVLELKAGDFQRVLRDHPTLAVHMLHEMSERLRFSTTYLEKAIAWAQRVAEGDYSMAMDQIRDSRAIMDPHASREDKADQLLSAFFKLVNEVKGREDELKRQLQRLTVQIDQNRRKQEYEDLTKTAFYSDLKQKAAELRKKRAESE